MIEKDKNELRSSLLKERDSLDVCRKRDLDKDVFRNCLRFFDEIDFNSNSVVLSYVSYGSETSTSELNQYFLNRSVILGVPVMVSGHNLIFRQYPESQRDWVMTKFGLKQPSERCLEIDLQLVSCIVIPGVGFEEEDGKRMGYGRGYYDRFLLQIPNVQRVGLCFEIQCVCNVFAEAHDQPLDVLITEQRIYHFVRKQ